MGHLHDNIPARLRQRSDKRADVTDVTLLQQLDDGGRRNDHKGTRRDDGGTRHTVERQGHTDHGQRI